MRRWRIGTRGSALALAQAGWVQARFRACGFGEAELVVIRTSGDRVVDRPLYAIGGKGLFVKEIEEALLAREIDCAVHSLKDLPAELAPGLVIAAVPEREDARDVLLTRAVGGLASIPNGGQVGTSSLRRAALLRASRPDLLVETLRGNVDTRLRKLEAGTVQAIVLANAGLRRLGIRPPYATLLPAEEFVPAIGQGALAIESRADDAPSLAPLQHEATRRAIDAERGFLLAVGGSCVTPLAAHAVVADGTVTLRALIAQPDGRRVIRGQRTGSAANGMQIGHQLAEQLLNDGGREILDALPHPT
jgi:hydroxymethylbilane synthase